MLHVTDGGYSNVLYYFISFYPCQYFKFQRQYFNRNVEMYLMNEKEKKRKYLQRVIQVERGSFTPLVFSTTGGMGPEAEKLVKTLAQKMEKCNGQRYSDSVSYIRRRLRFELLKTTVIALRGDRGSRLRNQEIEVQNLDLNLEPAG